MGNACKYCKCDLSQFPGKSRGAHVRNCAQNPGRDQASKKGALSQRKRRTYTLICSKCHSEFTRELTAHQFSKRQKFYCSRSCANSKEMTLEIREKISLSLGGRGPYNPPKKEGEKPEDRAFRIYTNWSEGNLTWAIGMTQHPISQSRYLRKLLIRFEGARCSRCGWQGVNPYSGKTPLQLEHIDGDCTNNTYANIALLCPNCHSLTPTFGGLNRGHGRKSKGFK